MRVITRGHVAQADARRARSAARLRATSSLERAVHDESAPLFVATRWRTPIRVAIAIFARHMFRKRMPNLTADYPLRARVLLMPARFTINRLSPV